MVRTKKNGKMTATATSSFPMAAGEAVFNGLGRGLLWLVARAFHAPVSSLILVTMTFGTAMATTNALYMQIGHHPAPLFAEQQLTTASVAPVKAPERIAPVVKQAPAQITPLPIATLTPTPAPVPAMADAVAKIDNGDVAALQQKLTALKFYEGEADGFYGPRTADAIRAFELSIGLVPVGALTPDVLDAVKRAKLPQASVSQTTQAPVSKPEARIAPQVELLPAKTEPAPQTASANGVSDPLVQIVQRVASAAQKSVSAPADNRQTVENVQRGLASLGFLRGKIDGVAGETTAKAIRNFEVYYNYKVTGKVTPELIDLLAEAGAKY